MNKWTMLSFVFENNTKATSMDRKDNGIRRVNGMTAAWNEDKTEPTTAPTNRFFASIYINGQLDLRAEYLKDVLANNGPLQLFKDPTFSGINVNGGWLLIVEYRVPVIRYDVLEIRWKSDVINADRVQVQSHSCKVCTCTALLCRQRKYGGCIFAALWPVVHRQ
jgi:hypothetical protein